VDGCNGDVSTTFVISRYVGARREKMPSLVTSLGQLCHAPDPCERYLSPHLGIMPRA
jgi:hypothetical protein